jgi:hypothetical protein
MSDVQQQTLDREAQQIAEGQRAKAFMEDAVVKRLLHELEKEYASEFLKADTDEKRRTAWAKAHALVDFTADLRGVFESGLLVGKQRSTREAAEARSRQRNPRT